MDGLNEKANKNITEEQKRIRSDIVEFFIVQQIARQNANTIRKAKALVDMQKDRNEL